MLYCHCWLYLAFRHCFMLLFLAGSIDTWQNLKKFLNLRKSEYFLFVYDAVV
jgi:hypothetical protein